MHVPSVIERKREGRELDDDEIAALIAGFTSGSIPDYQISAFAMAVYFRGMTSRETLALTRAMLGSGHTLRHSSGGRVVDKHSTGGVGDKVSLVLAPLLACDNLRVPMISGRGLGITGGTLDKLESIPGFNVNLDESAAMRQLDQIGVFMIGQTDDICPADRKLYALRDVTATVPSQPLIVASIMSKKLAESLDALVLDVKFGAGAFMKNRTDAQALAEAMRAIGEGMHVETSCVLTPMDQPLGHAVGNALEVAEAVEALQGRAPADLENLILDLVTRLSQTPRDQFAAWLNDGTAWKKFIDLVDAQGGDPATLDRLLEIHDAPIIHDLIAPASGTVARVDAEAIARGCLALGAGRQRIEDTVDFAVGCSSLIKAGTTVSRGDLLAKVHSRARETLQQELPRFQSAFTIE